MNRNDPLVAHLRNELQERNRDVKKYRDLYRNECKVNMEHEKQYQEIQMKYIQLLDDIESLKEDLNTCREHINSFKIPKPYKKWDQLKSETSKAKRKSDYRKCLDQSMMYLHEAQRVRIQMRVGNKEIFFLWSEREMSALRRKQTTINSVTNTNQIVQNSPCENFNSEEEDYIPENETDPDPFLPDGSWNKVHLRRILHVMDIFKISFKGYHELRMISRSILPALNRLKKARIEMSHEISSLHHRTVNFKSLFIFIEVCVFVNTNFPPKYLIIGNDIA